MKIECRDQLVPVFRTSNIHPCADNYNSFFRQSHTSLLGIPFEVMIWEGFVLQPLHGTIRNDQPDSATLELYSILVLVVKAIESMRTNKMELAFDLRRWREVRKEDLARLGIHRNSRVDRAVRVPIRKRQLSEGRTFVFTAFEQTVVEVFLLGLTASEEELVLIFLKLGHVG